jgi:hypothetical protein
MRAFEFLKESDIKKIWMSDSDLDNYVPDNLIQEWRELVGYNEDGESHPLWREIAGTNDPNSNDPHDRAMMVRVANEWSKMKNLPIRFFDVREAEDELHWLVNILYT